LTPPIRVGVVGYLGKMGQAVVAAVQEAPDLEVSCEIDQGDELSSLISSQTQVLIDFTTAPAALETLGFAVPAGINCVVGTTGFTKAQMAEIEALVAANPSVGVIIAPNFSIGAMLMMQSAAQSASHFDSVEIIEYHRTEKLDSPSGTAKATAESIAKARANQGLPALSPPASGDKARGEVIDGVTIHSVRGEGMVAHQEVIFGKPGERLTIRHDSFDRGSFMPGVLLATREAMKRPGLTLGLSPIIS
jgi:4-hydroxy-tetrahydrodipicolinate reductase